MVRAVMCASACRDDAQLLQRQGRGEQVPMLFCCHMMPLPLPYALPPLDFASGQPPSSDAILGRLQVLIMHHHRAARKVAEEIQ